MVLTQYQCNELHSRDGVVCDHTHIGWVAEARTLKMASWHRVDFDLDIKGDRFTTGENKEAEDPGRENSTSKDLDYEDRITKLPGCRKEKRKASCAFSYS